MDNLRKLTDIIAIIFMVGHYGLEQDNEEKNIYDSDIFINIGLLAFIYKSTDYDIYNTITIFTIWFIIKYHTKTIKKMFKNE